jgi:hypothetical protein
MKTNPKKLDDEDIFIRSTPWTPEERKSFSEFLKAEKKKRELRKNHSMKSASLRSKHGAPK